MNCTGADSTKLFHRFSFSTQLLIRINGSAKGNNVAYSFREMGKKNTKREYCSVIVLRLG